MNHSPWVANRKNLLGELHVYTKDGRRLTNERMNSDQDWEEIAGLVAVAPDLLDLLQEWKDAEKIDHDAELHFHTMRILTERRDGLLVKLTEPTYLTCP